MGWKSEIAVEAGPSDDDDSGVAVDKDGGFKESSVFEGIPVFKVVIACGELTAPFDMEFIFLLDIVTTFRGPGGGLNSMPTDTWKVSLQQL